MSPTVFVSGFTGYIALHTVNQLLAKGYKVIGSARSEAKAQKYANLLNNPNFSFVIVSDLCNSEEFDQVFKNHNEIELVFHMASPVVFFANDAKADIIDPAVNGTVNILKSIKKYGTNVKRVLITTSFASHCGYYQRENNKNGIINEDSKSTMTLEMVLNETDQKPYWASKAIAERLAWEFMEKESPNFTLTTLAPCYCFGPQAFDELKDESPSTIGLVRMLFGNKGELTENHPGVAIDVRDVAKGHVLALETSNTIGQRLIMGNEKFDSQLMVNLISDKFPQLELPDKKPLTTEDVDCPGVDSSKTLKLLGWEGDLIPFEKSVTELVTQMTN